MIIVFTFGISIPFSIIVVATRTWNPPFLNLLNISSSSFLKPLFSLINAPLEILPLAFTRPISGTASLALLNNIFEVHGPDSFIGLLGSVMQGCTDTTFYVISLYFGSIGIKKIRYYQIQN